MAPDGSPSLISTAPVALRNQIPNFVLYCATATSFVCQRGQSRAFPPEACEYELATPLIQLFYVSRASDPYDDARLLELVVT